MSESESQPRLSASERQVLVEIVEHFQRAWEQGAQPSIDESLPAEEPLHSAALVELVHADLKHRLDSAEAARVEQYLQRFPELKQDTEVVTNLIWSEYQLRLKRKPDLLPNEYRRRFPEYAKEVWELIQRREVSHEPIHYSSADRHEEPSSTESTNSIPRDTPESPLRRIDADGVRTKTFPTRLEPIVGGRRAEGRSQSESGPIKESKRVQNQYSVNRPYVPGGKHPDIRRGNSLIVALTTIAILVLVAAAAVMTYAYLKTTAALQREVAQRALAEEHEQEAQRALEQERDSQGDEQATLDDAVWNLYLSRIALAEQAWRAKHVSSAEEELEACPSQFRDWEWGYWNKQCHAELLTLENHESGVTNVAFSPDGSRIASTSDDKTVRVWDAVTGQGIHTLRGHAGPVFSVAFSPDGTRLVSGGEAAVDEGEELDKPGDLIVWDMATGREILKVQGKTGGCHCMAFSPAGQRVATAGSDHTVTVLEAATGEVVLTFDGHSDVVNDISYSPDGRQIASASGDRTVKVWDAATGKESITLRGHTVPVMSVAFSPDGNQIVSGGGEPLGDQDDNPGEFKVWDLATGRAAMTWLGHSNGVTRVAFSPDGGRIASASPDETIVVWDAASGQEMLTLRVQSLSNFAFNQDGSRIASSGDDQTVKIWDATAGQGPLVLRGHEDRVNCVAFSSGSGRIASASDDGTIKIWEATTGQAAITLRGHSGPVLNVAFSPDGTQIASGGEAADHSGELKIWNTSTGQEIRTLPGMTGPVRSVAFSPDGTRIAGGGGKEEGDGEEELNDGPLAELKIWNAGTGQEVFILSGHTDVVTSVAFSPDGKSLVSASRDGTAKVWDVLTGKETVTLNGHEDWVNCATFSPSSQWIATAGDDETVKFWDAATGEEDFTLPVNLVNGIVFSPDGERIVSCSNDRSVRLWDGATGDQTLLLRGHSDWVNSVAFSPDGLRIATGSSDHTVRIWDALFDEDVE